MRFEFIRAHRETFEVGAMCRVLEVSRSGYYVWTKRGESGHEKETKRLAAAIRVIHDASRRTYGSPRVHAELRAQGERCGKNRVARIMRSEGIASRRRRRFRKTTDSAHAYPVAPNLLNQEFTATAPNQVWLADITYIGTTEGWLYLAAVEDLFSRRVVGYSMSTSLATEFVVDALRMAVGRRPVSAGLVHHSDRGSQYASNRYRKLLAEHGLRCSMSGKGNCYDNAPMESFFSTLKSELVQHEHFESREQARLVVFEYIEAFYNRVRRHSSLGYCSPSEFEARHERVAA